MDQIKEFFNDPAIVGLWSIVVVALIDFALGVIQSIRQGVFDFKKLPQVLDSVVLQKVIPVAALGVAAFFVTDETQKAVLLSAYGIFSLGVLAALVKSLLEKVGVTGTYQATTLAQDKGLTPFVPPAGPTKTK